MTRLSYLATAACFLGVAVLIACDSGPGPTAPSADVELEPAHSAGSLLDRAASANRVPGELLDEGVPGEDMELEPEDTCARSPGFYCQNQEGGNPNMTAEEFEMFASPSASKIRRSGMVIPQPPPG